MSKYTIDQINTMSYTDFVGLVNQWNVPPGSFNTLTSWVVFGNITSNSNILEVACTTGFSSREIAIMTGATAIGIDLSEASIAAAQENKIQYAPNANLTYKATDALKFVSEEKYTHVIAGAALRFFPEPSKAVDHILKLLAPNGVLLTSEFYCVEPIPLELVEEALTIFNIQITQQNYKDVMSIYRDLTLLHEERHTLMQETDDDLNHYCDSSMAKFARNNPDYNKEALGAIRARLLKIKDMSNRLRPYQNYNVLVHKADSRYFPHRYTELF